MTRTGVLLRVLANNNELQKKLGDHPVYHAYRVESFGDVKLDTQEYPGMKRWLTPGATEVLSIGGKINDDFTMKCTSQCFMCGKTGHQKSNCWLNDDTTAKPASTSKDRGNGKPSKGPSKGGKKGAKGEGKSDVEERTYHKTSQNLSNR